MVYRNRNVALTDQDGDVADIVNGNLPIALRSNDGNGYSLLINESGQAHVVMRGKKDVNNSTTSNLGIDGAFKGSATDVLDYADAFVTVYADQVSATDGLCIQKSDTIDASDAVWARHQDCYTIPSSSGKTFSVQLDKQYIRVIYTNGGVEQTDFELTLLLKKTRAKPSSHRVQDSIIDDDDAELVKAVLTGEKPNGTFVNFQGTANGNFKTSIEEFETGVSSNSKTQLNVSPFMVDEDGVYGHMLGDTIFRGSPVVIDVDHHEIHCGDSYEATYNDDLGNAEVKDLLIIVPDEPGTGQTQKLYHFKDIIEVESECIIQLYEDATVSANGTAITSYNRNRNSALTDTLGIYYDPTVTGVGNSLWGPWNLGARRAIGGERGRTDELVLKNNTIYLLRITNTTTSACYLNIEFDYYVHPAV